MTSLPIEIAARMAVVGQWMDVTRFAALKAAVDAKMGRDYREQPSRRVQ